MVGIKATKYVTALHCYFLIWFIINFKWQSSSFRLHQVFPNFNGPNAFYSQIQQAPGPNFRKVEKSLTLYLVKVLPMSTHLGQNFFIS